MVEMPDSLEMLPERDLTGRDVYEKYLNRAFIQLKEFPDQLESILNDFDSAFSGLHSSRASEMIKKYYDILIGAYRDYGIETLSVLLTPEVLSQELTGDAKFYEDYIHLVAPELSIFPRGIKSICWAFADSILYLTPENAGKFKQVYTDITSRLQPNQ